MTRSTLIFILFFNIMIKHTHIYKAKVYNTCEYTIYV